MSCSFPLARVCIYIYSRPFRERQPILVYKLTWLNLHVLVMRSSDLFFICLRCHNLIYPPFAAMMYKFCLVRVTPTYQTRCSSSAFSGLFSMLSRILSVLSNINNTLSAFSTFGRMNRR